MTALTRAELGMPAADLVQQRGMSEQTYYRWKKRRGLQQIDTYPSTKKRGVGPQI